MIRLLIAACMIAQLSGCVIVPTHVTPPPPTAAVGRIKVVVPQPDVGAHAVYVGEIPWHFARLTLAPADGRSSPTVQTLANYRGDLVANGPIADLRPGAYAVRVDLVQVGNDHVEHVVATGLLEEQQLNVGGGNSLEVMVHPTEANSHVALTPSVLSTVAAPYWAGTVIVHDTTIIDRGWSHHDTVVIHQASEEDPALLHVEDTSSSDDTPSNDDPWAGYEEDEPDSSSESDDRSDDDT
ncbi:MAG: hypothetical protein JWM80_1983 [Cyanobacteria bacterium RYN_339]|nr:hypothetical protein [Cyanobacteria bacterium RYN_339]